MRENHTIVGDVRGMGMMCGLELVRDVKKPPAIEETKRVIEYALKRGVILQPPGGRFGNVLKMSPPLPITEEQLDFERSTLRSHLLRSTDGRYEKAWENISRKCLVLKMTLYTI